MGCCGGKDGSPAAPPLPSKEGRNEGTSGTSANTRGGVSSREQSGDPEASVAMPYATGQVTHLNEASFAQMAVVYPAGALAGTQTSVGNASLVKSELFHSCLDASEDHMAHEGLDAGVLVTAVNAVQMTHGHNQLAVAAASPTATPSDGGPPRSFAAFASTTPRRTRVRFQVPTQATSPLPPGLCDSLPPGSAKGKCDYLLMESWDFLNSSGALQALRKGSALFCCLPCIPGPNLQPVERAICAAFINLSSFRDEVEDNGVPIIDMNSESTVAKHLFLIAKTQYLLPNWEAVTRLTPELYSRAEFQKKIAPSRTTVIPKVLDRDKRPAVNTFCVNRELVLFFSVKTQYRVSRLEGAALPPLAALSDGLQPNYALLCERTRDDRGSDSTVKSKQVLLFHRTSDGGALLTHVQASVFSSLPGVVRKTIGNLGKRGGEEAGETACRLRHALAS
eukprot:TRINITY_DN61328_c0_g1_i1.p1 TRINITY_DN61328_c0_g1~~TRINITY_DN61328_c0_g1_i1.p1  ORF type:complete len:450 (+),score=69.73 TRINITY_DN61328_c0_g1_i1:84-1433(+)